LLEAKPAMRVLKVIFALAVLATLSGQTLRPELFPPEIGWNPSRLWPSARPEGAEGEFYRQQTWLVPTPDTAKLAHAFLYRPPGDGPFRLAVIAHASTENAIRRAQMPQPAYRGLVAFLVARGFAVLVPERLGHGATGGSYLEGQGDCEHPDYDKAGRETGKQIAIAVQALQREAFVLKDGAVVIGHSAGGWGALAAAGRRLSSVSSVIVFAAGRGGHADDTPGKVCAPEMLIKTAEQFGGGARIPVTWLVAENDSYFLPRLSHEMAEAFRRGGGKVTFIVLPAVGNEGHAMAETEDGVNIASRELDRALKLPAQAAARKPK
jgi:pimeloyl-ACP methyl ester carboxylesterase